MMKVQEKIVVQCAWVGSRDKKTKFHEFFARLVVRKAPKQALVAVARKLLVVIWNVLRYKQAYDPNKGVVHDLNRLKRKLNYHKGQVQMLEQILSSHQGPGKFVVAPEGLCAW